MKKNEFYKTELVFQAKGFIEPLLIFYSSKINGFLNIIFFI